MKVIILECEGVINQCTDTSASIEEWRPIPGSLEAVADLNQAGYRVVVAMNRPTAAQGRIDIEAMNDIQHKMHRRLEQVGGLIDAVFFCPHTEADACDCRLPKPGMLFDIAHRYHVQLSDLILIGCSAKSIAAATTAGIQTMVVRPENTTDKPAQASENTLLDDLEHAANSLINLDQVDQ